MSADIDFDDANLQQAVRKCWAGECCPSALRRRIEAMAADALDRGDLDRGVLDRSARGPFSRWGRWVLYPVAAAAAVALVFGVRHYENSVAPSSAVAMVAIPVSLQTELVRTHDHCSQTPNHQHLPGNGTDDASIARVMSAELHRPVLVARPSDPCWTYRGAAVCPVGAARSGHLVFRSGSDSLSVFSLPKSAMPDAVEGSEFECEADGHTIVGFVRDGAVFCIVGSGTGSDVSVARLHQLRKTLEPRITETASAAPVRDAELIRPIDR
jgi:hypothetical protein